MHVALSSDKFKVQMPGWKHTLNHLFILLLYSDTLILWEKFYISMKSWHRMTSLMKKYKIATSHAQTKGHFNLGFCFFKSHLKSWFCHFKHILYHSKCHLDISKCLNPLSTENNTLHLHNILLLLKQLHKIHFILFLTTALWGRLSKLQLFYVRQWRPEGGEWFYTEVIDLVYGKVKVMNSKYFKRNEAKIFLYYIQKF